MSTLDGVRIPAKQLLYPQFCVVPMGWTLALEVCQKYHERIAEMGDGMGAENRMVDGMLVPRMHQNGIHTEYVDNFVAMSQKRSVVEEMTQTMVAGFEKAGLPIHPSELHVGGVTRG